MKRTSSLELAIQSLDDLQRQNGLLRDDLARLYAFLSKIRSGVKWMNGMDTIKQTKSRIRLLAERSFENHFLTEEAPCQWLCAKEGTVIYSFRVAQLKGAIAIWGDIGSMIVDAGSGYTVGWLRGCVESTHYVLEKCNVKKDCFYPGEFKEALEYRKKEALEWVVSDPDDHKAKEALDDITQAIEDASHYDFDLTAYYEYMQSHPDSELHDSVYGYDSEAYWLVEGFRKFVNLYEATLAASAKNVD
jgi:hypothetical protein